MRYLLTMLIVLMALGPWAAMAQTSHTFKIRNGKLVTGGNAPTANTVQGGVTQNPAAINYQQQWMLAGLSSMMQRDYVKAEQYYNMVIEQYGGTSEAFLQRAITRRELKNNRAMTADAKTALSLLNQKIQQNPRGAGLYHKRSMALRLLKAFDLAKKDLHMAIRLKGKSGLTYQNDLQAIELEQQMAGANR